jgi:hypothetical protein
MYRNTIVVLIYHHHRLLDINTISQFTSLLAIKERRQILSFAAFSTVTSEHLCLSTIRSQGGDLSAHFNVHHNRCLNYPPEDMPHSNVKLGP